MKIKILLKNDYVEDEKPQVTQIDFTVIKKTEDCLIVIMKKLN